MTMLRLAEDVESDGISDVVDSDAGFDEFVGADEAWLGMTFTRMLAPLRHLKRPCWA